MRLEHIEVWHWQGLDHLCLPELSARMNLVVGPNGAGKTRLFTALNAVFFEKYKGSAEHKQRWQTKNGSEPPRVHVRFTAGGVSYTLEKRFLKSPEARLAGGGEVLADGEAEDRLSELLGFQTAGSRGATVDQMGLWPLLWVPQHSSHLSPSDHLNDSTRGRLDDVVGREAGKVAAGPLGDRVLHRAEAEHQLYWTAKTGKETGDLARAMQRLEDAERARCEAVDRRDATRAQADRLASCVERLATLAAELQSLDEELRAAAQSRTAGEALEVELKKRRDDVGLLKLELERAHEGFETRARIDKELVATREAAAALEPKLQAAQRRAERAEEQVRATEQAMTDAEARAEAARHQVRRAERQAARLRVAAELASAGDVLALAEQDEKALGEVKLRLAGLKIDARALKKLEKAEQDLANKRVALQAAAARVRIRALSDTTLDGSPLAPGESRELVVDRERTLLIGSVAEVTVEPGGQELATRHAEVEKAEHALRQQLEALEVASVAEAAERLERRREAEREQDRLETAVATRAPEGVEALRLRHAERTAALEALGADDPEAPDPAAAGSALDLAGGAFDAARAARDAARDERFEARAESEGLARDRAALDEKRSDLERRLAEQRDAAALELDEKAARERLAEAERQRDLVAARVEVLRLDDLRATCERLERAQKKKEQERAQVKDESLTLRGALGNLDARGLHEKVQDAEAEADAARVEEARLRRRAEAARALRETLLAARDRTREAVTSRIAERVEPYLECILPAYSLRVGDRWCVEGVACDDLALSFVELSGGLREQVALAVRFAMAESLAGDDVLPIVLDDPLVNTDPDKLRTMIHVLSQASRRLQVIVLSCDEPAYHSLGEDRRYRLGPRGEVTAI
jgi:energy-coupling factor transporter ATP-binding protein EcfA2